MKSPFVRFLTPAALVAACLAVSAPAMADAVVNGSIIRLGGDEVGTLYPGGIISTIDHIPFTVNTAGMITFDVLSWEYNYDINTRVDVNGDGEYACIDSLIRLFRNDGDLTIDDELAFNDDGILGDDGSVFGLDSYLQFELPVGSYILAIGGYNYSVEQAIEGVNNGSAGFYPVTLDENSDPYAADHGDYRVTFMGDVTVVPAPAAASLFAASGVFGLRRRRHG